MKTPMHEQRDSETIEIADIIKMVPIVACGDALDLSYETSYNAYQLLAC